LRKPGACGAVVNNSKSHAPEYQTAQDNKLQAIPTVTEVLFFGQQNNHHAGDHDENIENPANGPGKWDQVPVVGNGFNEPVGGKGMKSVHASREKKRNTDDGSGYIFPNIKMYKRKNDDEYCGAKSAPLQNGVGKAPGERLVHGIGQCSLSGLLKGGVKWQAIGAKIYSDLIQNKRENADGYYGPNDFG